MCVSKATLKHEQPNLSRKFHVCYEDVREKGGLEKQFSCNPKSLTFVIKTAELNRTE